MSNLIETFSGKLCFGKPDYPDYKNSKGTHLSSDEGGKIFIEAANYKFNNEDTRKEIVNDIHKAINGQKQLRVELQGTEIDNVYFEINNNTLSLHVDINGNINGIQHPLTEILPAIDGQHEFVYTSFCKNANLYYLDLNLEGPRLFKKTGKRQVFYDKQKSLFCYLSRLINNQNSGKPDGISKRFIEPGVGRSFLVDLLSLNGQPAYKDFSATGIGLTPYSLKGFVFIGRNPDGKVALIRAKHRKNIADKLNEIGCRAGKVVAIIELPDEKVQMMDGTFSPRAIVIRAFKNILRIKQIDPVAGFYHSLQHSAKVSSMIIEDLACFIDFNLSEPDYKNVAKLSMSAMDFENFTASSDDFYKVVSHHHENCVKNDAKAYRQNLIKKYCYDILNFSRKRIALELECQLTIKEYIDWYAESLGKQLALMKEAKFLHDYHHPGINRYNENWIYTLIEHNVTLSGEFADLETSVFVDDAIEENMFNLQISKKDVELLRNNFQKYHLTDYDMAKRVIRSLAYAAVCGELISEKDIKKIVTIFEENYKNK